MAKLNNIVMFACNQGGHFSQMMALKQLFGKYETVLVTDNVHASKEKTPALEGIGCVEYAMGMAKKRNELSEQKNLKETSRWQSLSGYISIILESRKVWKKYHPKVIVSTGSNIAVGLFIYGKLKGSKLIYIESRARVYGKSVTGKIVTKFADQIYVQWPEMLEVYPNAKYCGTLV